MTEHRDDPTYVVLPRRRFLDHAALACGLVLAVPTIGYAVEVADEPRASGVTMLAAMTIILVLLPLGIGLALRGLNARVGPHAIAVEIFGRPRTRVSLAAVTQIQPGEVTMNSFPRRHPTIRVLAEGPEGRQQVFLSGQLFTDLGPALDVLVPLVAARPELLTDTDDARALWSQLLRDRGV